MKRRSLLYRLIISYVIVGILPLVIIMGFAFAREIRTVRNSLEKQVTNSAELIQAQFKDQFDSMAFISLNLVSNQDFLKAARSLGKEPDLLALQLDYAQVERAVNTYAIIDSNYDVLFFNDEGCMVCSVDNNHGQNYTYRMGSETLEAVAWLKDVRNNYGQTVLLSAQTELLPGYGGDFFALVRGVRNPGKLIGYLAVFTHRENLDYMLRAPESLGGALMILENDDKVIYAGSGFPQARCLDGNGAFNLSALGGDYIVAESADPASGIAVVITVPNHEVYRRSLKSLVPLIAQGLIMLLIMGVGTFIFGRRLSAPITALTEAIRQTTMENLNQSVHPDVFQRYREADYLFRQFTQMRVRLDEAMKREIAMQVLQMRERLHSLQAQINPHFLYNTLNIIGIMGEEAGSTDIYDACFRLSSIMRYSIADRNPITALVHEEIDNTRAYFELMKLRYVHRFEYAIETDPAVDRVEVPRLILQPFIENTFEHAYDNAHTVVRARVVTRLENGRWNILICDDGCGIPSDKLERIRSEIERGVDGVEDDARRREEKGIGVCSTILRLKLFFGDGFRYSIDSVPGCGTTILLSAFMKEESLDGKTESADR